MWNVDKLFFSLLDSVCILFDLFETWDTPAPNIWEYRSTPPYVHPPKEIAWVNRSTYINWIATTLTANEQDQVTDWAQSQDGRRHRQARHGWISHGNGCILNVKAWDIKPRKHSFKKKKKKAIDKLNVRMYYKQSGFKRQLTFHMGFI